MIDRSKRARVIDFGSVAPFYTSQKFKLHDNTRIYANIKFGVLKAISIPIANSF